jgi:hypothetical protein
MNMGKRTVAALAAVLVTVLAAGAASAGQPAREPLFSEGFDLPNNCSFPVFIEVTANKEYVTFFQDGRIQITGKLFVAVTNVDSGESIDLNISGPARISELGERYAGRACSSSSPRTSEGPGSYSRRAAWTSSAQRMGSLRTSASRATP